MRKEQQGDCRRGSQRMQKLQTGASKWDLTYIFKRSPWLTRPKMQGAHQEATESNQEVTGHSNQSGDSTRGEARSDAGEVWSESWQLCEGTHVGIKRKRRRDISLSTRTNGFATYRDGSTLTEAELADPGLDMFKMPISPVECLLGSWIYTVGGQQHTGGIKPCGQRTQPEEGRQTEKRSLRTEAWGCPVWRRNGHRENPAKQTEKQQPIKWKDKESVANWKPSGIKQFQGEGSVRRGLWTWGQPGTSTSVESWRQKWVQSQTFKAQKWSQQEYNPWEFRSKSGKAMRW